jgi:hypothetical protein
MARVWRKAAAQRTAQGHKARPRSLLRRVARDRAAPQRHQAEGNARALQSALWSPLQDRRASENSPPALRPRLCAHSNASFLKMTHTSITARRRDCGRCIGGSHSLHVALVGFPLSVLLDGTAERIRLRRIRNACADTEGCGRADSPTTVRQSSFPAGTAGTGVNTRGGRERNGAANRSERVGEAALVDDASQSCFADGRDVNRNGKGVQKG